MDFSTSGETNTNKEEQTLNSKQKHIVVDSFVEAVESFRCESEHYN